RAPWTTMSEPATSALAAARTRPATTASKPRLPNPPNMILGQIMHDRQSARLEIATVATTELVARPILQLQLTQSLQGQRKQRGNSQRIGAQPMQSPRMQFLRQEERRVGHRSTPQFAPARSRWPAARQTRPSASRQSAPAGGRSPPR